MRENKYRKYIENTTWIVPRSTLLAYKYFCGRSVSVVDQTVWVIDKFDQGYFFGYSYVGINKVPSSQMAFVGSITSFGDVYITFFPVADNLRNTDLFSQKLNQTSLLKDSFQQELQIVTGVGKFKKSGGKYYFVMQMNSAQNNFEGLTHWSYMISVQLKNLVLFPTLD